MMAEKRDCEGTTEDEGDDIKRKRLDTNAFAGTRSNISDDTSNDISDDTSNDISDDTSSECDKDPLSDLTRNQRVVFYTMFLCSENPGYIKLDDDDVTMVDIDVSKTLKELVDRGLVLRVGTLYKVSFDKLYEIIVSYTVNCLLSDIDKDFFIDVANNHPLYEWYTTQDPIINRDVSSPQDSRSITVMRLMIERRMDGVYSIIERTGYRFAPSQFFAEYEEFVRFWKNHCTQRNVHPSDWSNGVCDREMGRYFSAYTILSGFEEVNIPREILHWDYEARCRYVECARKGTQTIHRARAMIVGCAGAGKTTLLKRLQKRSLHELQQIQSTIGLEVHEDIFEFSEEKNILIAVEEADKEGKALLSVMDFGGQCAYYACHQVYLSRRAFYLLVIDMSKSFDEKVDPALCEQQGTMFADWTYGEFRYILQQNTGPPAVQQTSQGTLGPEEVLCSWFPCRWYTFL